MNNFAGLSIPDMVLPKTSAPNLFYDRFEKINRLIITGNGFDVAHGLESTFRDFIYDYTFQIKVSILQNLKYNDNLLTIKVEAEILDHEDELRSKNQKETFEWLMNFRKIPFLKVEWTSTFIQSLFLEIEAKKWVDVEIMYFNFLKNLVDNNKLVSGLNNDFIYLKELFLNYLKKKVEVDDFPNSSELLNQMQQEIKPIDVLSNTIKGKITPNNYCLLNFNYTNIAKKYCDDLNDSAKYIPIHGSLDGDDISIQSPIFGFGDELDSSYLKFELLNNDELFMHIKSFKYLQFRHYRNLIEFIEQGPYQVQIFGHSCGVSDRTLLNTIFENENCISIKQFYYNDNGVDDYEQKSYSIARHFKSKSNLRDKVVNKKDCEPMVQPFNC